MSTPCFRFEKVLQYTIVHIFSILIHVLIHCKRTYKYIIWYQNYPYTNKPNFFQYFTFDWVPTFSKAVETQTQQRRSNTHYILGRCWLWYFMMYKEEDTCQVKGDDGFDYGLQCGVQFLIPLMINYFVTSVCSVRSKNRIRRVQGYQRM